MEFTQIAINSLIGLASGTAYSLSGYLKSSTGRWKKLEDIDWKKAIKTVALGSIVGAVAGASGHTQSGAEEWLKNAGIYAAITVFIENTIKALSRRFGKKTKKVVMAIVN
ncbi:MAG: hypothetical protein DRP29_03070 [Thermodesulfobacteriota bacterium]|nr:MAG: hypothetical protein DRP29_03070 [Thermodesulfobacteriota bacterium]